MLLVIAIQARNLRVNGQYLATRLVLTRPVQLLPALDHNSPHRRGTANSEHSGFWQGRYGSVSSPVDLIGTIVSE